MRTFVCAVVMVLTQGAAVAAPVDDLLARGEKLRQEGRLAEAVAVLREAVAADPDRARAHAMLAETLAWNKEFPEAERVYLEALAKWPDDLSLRRGYAQLLLWTNRFRAGEEAFAAILREQPDDNVALLGAAQGAYWSGDYRAARSRFRQLVTRDPANSAAAEALRELNLVARGRYEVNGAFADDSQPLDRSTVNARLSMFSDPLTRWDLRGSLAQMADDQSELDIRTLGGGVTTTLPRLRLTLGAGVDYISFSDDTADTFANALVSWRMRDESVSVSFDQFPLLGTATAIRRRENASRYALAYSHQPDAALHAVVTAHWLTYTDDNEGAGADAYVLLPLFRRKKTTLRAGASAAWRDTTEDRFVFTGFDSELRDDGLYDYRFSGVYDPYWTPNDLVEARLIAGTDSSIGNVRVHIQADVGWAREKARSFGPAFGETPTPVFTFPITISRTYTPWRVAADVTLPINRRVELRMRYRHETTAFYDMNEFEASLGGHL